MPRMSDLTALLAALEPLLKKARPAVMASLAPPAAGAALEALRETVLRGRELPAELVAWFGWHDGQTKPLSFSSEDNYFLHSSDSAVDAWRFLTDPSEGVRGYEPRWIPLFENGAGDHRVFDPDTGAILAYFHDDDARPTVFADLATWAERMRASLAAAPGAPEGAAMSGAVAWVACAEPPSEQEVQDAAIGTAYYCVAKSPQIRVKTAPDTWLKASGRDEAAATAQIHEHLARAPTKDSGYWETDWDCWRACKKNKATLRTGRVG